MNSKERVSAVLAGQIPDKIPYGELAIDCDTVEKIVGHATYLRAKAKTQIALWEGRRDEVAQSWKEDIVALFSRLDCIDIINLDAVACGLLPPRDYEPLHPRKINDTTWEDREGKVYKYSDVTKDITMVEDPQKWTREYALSDFLAEENLTPPDQSIFEVVDHVIANLGDSRFIIGPSGGEVSMFLLNGDMERGLCEYLLAPEVVKAAIRQAQRSADFNDEYYIREGADAVIWGQDFSSNAGPFLSPEIFNDICLPPAMERVRQIKANHGLYVIKHACGNNWALMDMFVRAGYDCYQGIQPSASMDIKKLKTQYGGDLCLWGGVSVENLVSGTKDDVKKEVAAAIRSAAAGGKYIFGSSHSIAVGIEYGNFIAMLDEFENLRYCY